jgi:diaminohydroxyphosphoribosylaminopyrimidine deaminase/5-amino-6-(5-phosphoribosylamino)uracil reductase
MSLDGCIGLPGPRPLKLSGPEDLRRVHQLRAQSDAILVGVGTVLADDPKLTVNRDLVGKPGRNPTRVVLDASLRTPPGSHVLDGTAPTLIFHGRKGGALAGGAQLARVAADRHGFLDLKAVLADLGSRGVESLMVEGGATVLGEFFRAGLVDEFTVYLAPRFVGEPDAPRVYAGPALEDLGLACASAARLGEGALLRFVRS